MPLTLAAAFPSFADADHAVSKLHDAGIPREHVSVLVAESSKKQHFKIQETNKGAEGALGGGVVGGGLGALAAGLVSLGIIAAPGVGLVAAGPIIAALAGAGAGAAAGSLVGGLVGLGIPEHEAKVLDEQVRRGGILIAVSCGSPAQEKLAKDILAEAGAGRISHAS